jgi:hypothetical protein
VQGVPVFEKWVELPGDLGLLPETAQAPLTGPNAIPTPTAPIARSALTRRLISSSSD